MTRDILDLQRFNGGGSEGDAASTTEAMKGKKLVYAFRIKSEAASKAATLVAFTTENSRSISKDADSTATKDGTIRTPGATEQEISVTALMSKADKTIPSFETAMKKDEVFEIWEIDLTAAGDSSNSGKYAAMYFQGYLTSLEITSNAEDYAEVSLTFGINGDGASGYATLSASQAEAAAYSFADTTKTSG